MLVRLKPIYITATYTVKATLGSMKVARVSSCYTFLIEMHTGVHNTSHSCLQSCNINLLNYWLPVCASVSPLSGPHNCNERKIKLKLNELVEKNLKKSRFWTHSHNTKIVAFQSNYFVFIAMLQSIIMHMAMNDVVGKSVSCIRYSSWISGS